MMYLLLEPSQIQLENFTFLYSVKNIIMKNSTFTKFMYSDETCMLNSLFLEIPLSAGAMVAETTAPHKWRYCLSPAAAAEAAALFAPLEQTILTAYNPRGKIPAHKLTEVLSGGNLYANLLGAAAAAAEPRLFVKIFGLWENATEYGLTYKFVTISGNSY